MATLLKPRKMKPLIRNEVKFAISKNVPLSLVKTLASSGPDGPTRARIVSDVAAIWNPGRNNGAHLFNDRATAFRLDSVRASRDQPARIDDRYFCSFIGVVGQVRT